MESLPIFRRRHVGWLAGLCGVLGIVWVDAADLTGRVFELREPEPTRLLIRSKVSSFGAARHWARPVGGGKEAEVTSQLVVRLVSESGIDVLLIELGLRRIRTVDSHTWILAAPDPLEALNAAQRLAHREGVEVATPVFRKHAARHFPFAPVPEDPYFARQTYLEALDPSTGFPLGAPDLRIRSAWPWTRGAGVTIAVVDQGVELTHPDLESNAAAGHFNYVSGVANGGPSTLFQSHGTAVAGIAAARGNNQVGMSGVAPESHWVSWVIFDAVDNLPTDAELASLFENGRGTDGGPLVAVQNHSWGNSDFDVLSMSLVESIAIKNAVTTGRGGLGNVLVRSAGNTRAQDYNFVAGVGDANLDAYAADPHHMTVGAVRQDGRVASYSTPGACLWVAAMGGDPADAGSPGLFTTDRTGAHGANTTFNSQFPDLWNYAVGTSGFEGTSAAAPQVAGLAALVLSLRPDLGWRDVQQVIALSARHLDLADPALMTNGAGLRVSPNLGFGIPDAGVAVRLASVWTPRSAAVEVRVTNLVSQPIPDDGLRVLTSAGGDFGAAGSVGLHVDQPTAELPLYNLGVLPIPNPPAGSFAVLIPGGIGSVVPAIDSAASAGAAFAIVSAATGTDARAILRGTDFVRIPAVQVGHSAGESLKTAIDSSGGVRAKGVLRSAVWAFPVTTTLTLEKVGVTLHWQHPRMQDLRVTLRSPAGTLSVLQRPGAATSAVPASWTFGSSHHLGEPSVGTWTLVVSDEAAGATGTVDSAVLTLSGVPIVDVDADGLDDRWEFRAFGSLKFGPQDDPDGDGRNNAVEQLIGTNPAWNDLPLELGVALQSDGRLRVSWPGRAGVVYDLEAASDPAGPWSVRQSLPGREPETGVLAPAGAAQSYYRVHQVP